MLPYILAFLPQLVALHIDRTDTSLEAVSHICGDPPVIANSTYSMKDRYANLLEYTCYDGFTVAGTNESTTFNVTCSTTSKSYVGAQSCIVNPCKAPPAIANGVLTSTTGSSISIGTVISHNCKPGYTGDGLVNGPKRVEFVCDAGNTWLPVIQAISSCIEITCGIPPLLSRTTTTMDMTKQALLYQTINYTCASGMYVAGTRNPFKTSFKLTCGDDGDFLPTEYPTCVRPVCGPSPSFPSAKPVKKMNTADVKDTLLYNCVSGTTVSTDATSHQFRITCSMTGTLQADWVYPKGLQCTPLPCHRTPTFTNANLVGNTTQFYFGETAQFKCIDGYGVSGTPGYLGFTASCDESSIWSASTVHDCEPLTCGTSDNLPSYFTEYGYLIPFPTAVAIYGGAEMSVVCNEGAVNAVSGNSSFNFVCGRDGYFTSQGVCSVPCPSLASVVVNATATDSALLWFTNQTSTVTCNPGYTVSGTRDGSVVSTQSAMCGRDGTYTNALACTPIMCTEPSSNFGGGDIDEPVTGSIVYGTVVKYTCPSGYYESVSQSRTFSVACGDEGKLDPTLKCERIRCLNLPELSNAKASTNPYQYFYYEDKFTFSCNSGYGPTAEVDATCDADGTWFYDGACSPTKSTNFLLKQSSEGRGVTSSAGIAQSLSFVVLVVSAMLI